MARFGLGAAVVDGKIYVLGGWQGPIGQTVHTAVVEEYDPATDTWTRRADMPAARGAHSVTAVNGMIYAIGGWNTWGREVSTVEAYDPATNTWTTKADMPTARLKLAACVVDGRIYAFGGSVWGCNVPAIPTVEVYDPATDTWNQTSDMPMAKWGHSASVVAGKVYIIGGIVRAITADLFLAGKIDEDEMRKLNSTSHMYDPATDSWTAAANIPHNRTRHAAAVVDGKIYVIGGDFGPQNEIVTTSTVEEYDPGLPGDIPSVR